MGGDSKVLDVLNLSIKFQANLNILTLKSTALKVNDFKIHHFFSLNSMMNNDKLMGSLTFSGGGVMGSMDYRGPLSLPKKKGKKFGKNT